MKRYGEYPYLECSSSGDCRFSAFFARIKSLDNRSIEDLYQAFKIFSDGSTGLTWKEAKGRRAVNMKDAHIYYSKLWDMYISENPELMHILMQQSGLQNRYAREGTCNQAQELWRIRKAEVVKDAYANMF
jgi:hypothetical protein